MATHFQTSGNVAVIAREESVRSDYAFLAENQALRWLEGRSRRICSHNRTIEERFVLIVNEFAIVFAAFATYKYVGVVGGA